MERRPYLKPRPLHPGSRIAVVAPASPPPPERLKVGLDILHRRGFDVQTHQQTFLTQDYLAGNDGQRLHALHSVLSDPDVDAVWCARGGYGTLRAMARLPAIERTVPPALLGFSDVTVLLAHVTQRWGWVTFHAPNVTTIPSLNGASRDALNDFLDGNSPIRFEQLETLHPGKGQGELLVMNLAMLCSLAGTPFFPDLKGRILVLEEVGEAPYRLDRLLTQLLWIPSFQQIAGLVLGDLDFGGKDPGVIATLDHIAATLKVPCVAGFPIGHGSNNHIVPLGVSALLDATLGLLEIQESPLAG